MTRDEIIRMVKEIAGSDFENATVDEKMLDELMPLCMAVAAAEQERLNKKIAALEADVDHFFKLSGQYLERANKAEEAVAAERERCAQLCESYGMPDGTSETARVLAAAIRRMK